MAQKYYQVDVIGYGDWQPLTGVRFFSMKRKNVFPPLKYLLLFMGLCNQKYFDQYFWLKKQYRRALEILLRENYDLVHANDWDALPVASVYKNKSDNIVLFDAHEFSLGINESLKLSKLHQKYRNYLFKKYGDGVSERITVADSIKCLYQKHFDWDFNVILNAPRYQKIPFRPTNGRKIHLVHHGGAMPPRNLEEFIYLVEFLEPRFILHFYLIPSDKKYLQKIKKMSSRSTSQIIFHDPVKPEDIPAEVSKYDIGIPLIRVEKESYLQSLPNKFFDFIMGGLMVVVSPLPMMMRFIDQYNVGVHSESMTAKSVAKVLLSLNADEINQYKQNSLLAASKLNAQVEMKKLHSIYENILQ